MATDYKLIGKNFLPPDVVAKVTGQAKYAEDFRAEGMLFTKLLLSQMPNGRVRRLDVRAAERMPGVVAILTPDDVPEMPPGQEPILTKEPKYVGEPIVAVVAVDEATAAAAIEAINIDIQPMPFVVDPLDSLRPGGPDVWQGRNVNSRTKTRVKWSARDFAAAGPDQLPMGEAVNEWSFGDLDAAFAEADLVLDESFVTQAHSHHTMESRSTMVYWQNGKVYVHTSVQSHAFAAPSLAALLGVELKDLVLITQNTGGGFGSKNAADTRVAAAALLSKKANGRPVMMRVTRDEEFYFGRCRAGFQGRAKVGFRKDGKITGVDLFIVQSNGPYQGFGDDGSAAGAVSIVYQPQAMRFRGVPVHTNTPPRTAFRGPGENQLAASFEPLLDIAARKLGLDRVAIRRINAPDHDGTVGANQGPITSSYLREALDIGAEKFKWKERQHLSGTRRGSKIVGIGVGQAYHSSGNAGFDGLAVLKPDGKLYIHSGEGNLGTYSFAGTARAAAEALGMPWERCEVVWGDSRIVPWTTIQAGSNTSHTMSRAKWVAGLEMKRRLQEIAAIDFGGSADDYEVANERVFLKSDSAKGLTFAAAASRAIALGGKYSGHELPDNLHALTTLSAQNLAGTGLVVAVKDNLERGGTVPALASTFVELEVDVETGKVKVVDYFASVDCGKVQHPQSLATQIFGGAAQGFGLALFERHVFDSQLGWPATKRLYTSKPPTYLDLPLEMKWAAVDKPDPYSPTGAKGVGEPVMGAAASAIVCAISDALGGHAFKRIPILPDMVLNQLSGQPQSFKPLEVNV